MQTDIHVYSNHLLVRQEIEKVLTSNTDHSYCVLPALFNVPAPRNDERRHLFILDTCGLPNWPEIVYQWRQNGASAIIFFIAPESDTQAEKLRMISLGAAGILSISSNWKEQLVLAIQSIIRGELWISRSILGEYVKRTLPATLKSASSLGDLTPREREIQILRFKSFSNKQIANALGISERTVKFHVSNIIQKSRARQDRELPEELTISKSAFDTLHQR